MILKERKDLMKLTSQFMRKFYQLMAVVLLVLGALFPTVVTYA